MIPPSICASDTTVTSADFTRRGGIRAKERNRDIQRKRTGLMTPTRSSASDTDGLKMDPVNR